MKEVGEQAMHVIGEREYRPGKANLKILSQQAALLVIYSNKEASIVGQTEQLV